MFFTQNMSVVSVTYMEHIIGYSYVFSLCFVFQPHHHVQPDNVSIFANMDIK
jgi:hypothetical protein